MPARWGNDSCIQLQDVIQKVASRSRWEGFVQLEMFQAWGELLQESQAWVKVNPGMLQE